tara:strand:- start:3714 stop:4706 length:993 start_codon:yes stop_codon:yes gene_type:complete
MIPLRNLLGQKYYAVSYLQFCERRGTSDKIVQKNLKDLRSSIKYKPVVFIDWEHERVIKYQPAYNFLGFKEILGEYYNTNRWAISVPTFGHQNYGERQVNNLDFLIYVNSFNKEYNPSMIDHSSKKKDFLYLNGKPHPFRVFLMKELVETNLLTNSVWSANSPYHSWINFEQTLPAEYEWPKWRGKVVDGYDDSTRKVYHPMYNDTICSIVPETLADNDCHYITEKTCKPIMAEHLFVILSGAGFLKNLRDLGFKTFHEHFDESYDNCLNLHDRIQKIITTLKQIKSMDVNRLYNDTAEIRKHNRELFFNENFYDEFNNKQLQKLSAYFS